MCRLLFVSNLLVVFFSIASASGLERANAIPTDPIPKACRIAARGETRTFPNIFIYQKVIEACVVTRPKLTQWEIDRICKEYLDSRGLQYESFECTQTTAGGPIIVDVCPYDTYTTFFVSVEVVLKADGTDEELNERQCQKLYRCLAWEDRLTPRERTTAAEWHDFLCR